MIEACLNPKCQTPFARLGRGEVYALESRSRGTTEFFWLCDACLPQFAPAMSGNALGVVPRTGKRRLPPPNPFADVRIAFRPRVALPAA